jgi:hypothetical protein
LIFKNFYTANPNTMKPSRAPLLLESFPKRPRTRFEASGFGGSHKYKQNNTNKLPSFIGRCFSKPWVLKFETILLHVESLVKLKRVISK